MNGTTLKALRLALGYTQPEAASMIGGVALRTWKYWEAGNIPVPLDVENKMYELFDYKREVIEAYSCIVKQCNGAECKLNPGIPVMVNRKPLNMAMGELAGMFKNVVLEVG